MSGCGKKVVTKKTSTSRSAREGLQFIVCRIEEFTQTALGVRAGVYLTAIQEYMCAEVLELTHIEATALDGHPVGRVTHISEPVDMLFSEIKTMEDYLGASLWTVLTRPSSSSAGAGTRTLTLRTCIDYQGVNDNTLKNREFVETRSRRWPGRLFIRNQARTSVLEWGHSSNLACQAGTHQMLRFIRQRFWWPSLLRVIPEFVAACAICTQNKTPRHAPSGLLQPLPVPQRP
ncbi:hypothetical protein DPEC_G00039320 [Dallia pectoralis]|uniref:Uncharacterized protein n=1 Tax=Dallia pectoralis TaxID=75939 RepID=A0ACC2HFA0_DALPE|nr:hypothetical protein DPEC_G00039320 [Dallia pectoralis]